MVPNGTLPPESTKRRGKEKRSKGRDYVDPHDNYLGRRDRDLYKGVRKAQLKAPMAAKGQYIATYKAMNRMRTSLNRPPIPDLYLELE